MKTKILLFSLTALLGSLMNAQFTTGNVVLGSSGMTASISTTATQVTLVLTGPSNVWMGLNFTNSGMSSGSDGFIYSSAGTRDYQFSGTTAPTADSSQDWTVVSNTVSGTTRTITATRSLTGGSGDYAFPNSAGSSVYAWAKGDTNSGLNLAYHGQRGYSTFTRASNLGVNDIEAVRKFSVSENPIKSDFKFQNYQSVDSFKVYDVHGRLISNEKEMKAMMDASYLKTGMYFLEIKTKDGQTVYEKVIKE